MDYPQDTCFEVRAALPLFVGGDLEREELAAVEAHLASCPACGSLHARAHGARRVLTDRRAAADRAPAPDLWPEVRASLRDEGLLAPAGPRPLATPAPALARRAARLPLGLLSAAAAVIFAFLLAGAFDGAAGGPVSPPTFGSGGVLTDVTPIQHREAPLRHLREGEEPMYLRARELRTEQGLIGPTPAPRPPLVQPAGLRRSDDR